MVDVAAGGAAPSLTPKPAHYSLPGARRHVRRPCGIVSYCPQSTRASRRRSARPCLGLRRRTLSGGNVMKTVGVLLAGLLLAGLGWPQSASADDVPPGTYRRSCGDAYLQGGTLIAACRRVNGSAQPTALPAVQYCVGDIGNLNGALTCT